MAHLGEFGRELAALDVGEGSGPAEPDTFTFHGETFTVREHVSALPRMRYAHALLATQDAGRRVNAMFAAAATDEDILAARRVDGQAMTEWMAAQYRYLQDVIDPAEWDRFEAAAVRAGADQAELVAVANGIIAAVAGRPRTRSGDSPSGPSTSGGGSTAGSVSTAGPAPSGRGGDQPVEETTAEQVAAWTPAQAQRAALARMMQPVAEAVTS